MVLLIMRTREEYNAYMAKYNNDRYHRRRREVVVLLGGTCRSCGTTNDLEIDHIDRKTKRHNISKLINGNWEKLLAELEHCQLLCVVCHKEKSDQEQSLNHGQGVTGKKNCRCELCGPLKRGYMREFKKRQKAPSSSTEEH